MTVSTVQAIAAGFAAAILGLAILTGSAAGILFALITALPILWVSLRHGVRPGLLAAGISVAVQGLLLGPVAVIGQGLFNAAPAALLGGLADLFYVACHAFEFGSDFGAVELTTGSCSLEVV